MPIRTYVPVYDGIKNVPQHILTLTLFLLLLQSNCVAVEDFDWFREFLFYAVHQGEELAESDEDNLLLASIVEKVVLPKLAGGSASLVPRPLPAAILLKAWTMVWQL